MLRQPDVDCPRFGVGTLVFIETLRHGNDFIKLEVNPPIGFPEPVKELLQVGPVAGNSSIR